MAALCILVEQVGVRQGRRKKDTTNGLGRSVFPRTLVPLDRSFNVPTSLAVAAQECDEFRSQGLNKPVSLGRADGTEVESQKERQSETQQRGFPICFGPAEWLRELLLSIVGSCFQPLAAL